MPGQMHGTPTDSVTGEIVNAVATATGRDPNTLPPLYNVIDPDALDMLMNRPPSIGHKDASVEVTFAFADTTVTVSSTNRVDVAAGTSNGSADRTRSSADD